MAQCTRFVCDHCAHAVKAWSDGNPYYRDAQGRKRHAYHPDHDALARCIGNDEPHLCLACGALRTVDSDAPRRRCRCCRSADLVPTTALDGRTCPYRKTGAQPAA